MASFTGDKGHPQTDHHPLHPPRPQDRATLPQSASSLEEMHCSPLLPAEKQSTANSATVSC